MESWFHTLKNELVDGPFASRRVATAALFEYIEVFYNRQRSHTGTARMTPVEIEELAQRREA
jgi:transposase InsO family protein